MPFYLVVSIKLPTFATSNYILVALMNNSDVLLATGGIFRLSCSHCF